METENVCVDFKDRGLIIPPTENEISPVHAHIPLGNPLVTVISVCLALHLILDYDSVATARHLSAATLVSNT